MTSVLKSVLNAVQSNAVQCVSALQSMRLHLLTLYIYDFGTALVSDR